MDCSSSIVKIEGRLTGDTLRALRRQFDTGFASRPPQMTIDLRKVTHYDSSALATLLTLRREIERAGTQCEFLVELHALRKLLTLSGCAVAQAPSTSPAST